jgi:hypothetical protein
MSPGDANPQEARSGAVSPGRRSIGFAKLQIGIFARCATMANDVVLCCRWIARPLCQPLLLV